VDLAQAIPVIRTTPASSASASMGILLIEISFFIFAFIEFFSLFDFELLQKILSKNTYTSITQLPDIILLTSSGKPCHLPHLHYLPFCP
jgi:hypothetical protein